MALMLLVEVFLFDSFSVWTVDSFLCWSAERQPTKHQEELSCKEQGEGLDVLGTGS